MGPGDSARRRYQPYGDLTGQRFGWLTVLDSRRNANGKTVYLCECKCGTLKTCPPHPLVHGRTVSCGCYKRNSEVSRARQMLVDPAVRKARSLKAGESLKRKVMAGETSWPARTGGAVPEEVLAAIIADHARGTFTIQALAERYGVSIGTVSRALPPTAEPFPFIGARATQQTADTASRFSRGRF